MFTVVYLASRFAVAEQLVINPSLPSEILLTHVGLLTS